MKTIESVKAYRTNATIFLANGESFHLDYDLQDAHYFDSQADAGEWLRDTMSENGIEYDEDELLPVLSHLWNQYCD